MQLCSKRNEVRNSPGALCRNCNSEMSDADPFDQIHNATGVTSRLIKIIVWAGWYWCCISAETARTQHGVRYKDNTSAVLSLSLRETSPLAWICSFVNLD